jgi:hypothetical protein
MGHFTMNGDVNKSNAVAFNVLVPMLALHFFYSEYLALGY